MSSSAAETEVEAAAAVVDDNTVTEAEAADSPAVAEAMEQTRIAEKELNDLLERMQEEADAEEATFQTENEKKLKSENEFLKRQLLEARQQVLSARTQVVNERLEAENAAQNESFAAERNRLKDYFDWLDTQLPEEDSKNPLFVAEFKAITASIRSCLNIRRSRQEPLSDEEFQAEMNGLEAEIERQEQLQAKVDELEAEYERQAK